MKKYISAILIPCFLIQLCSCYSSKEISLEELSNSEEAIITTKDSTTYRLNRDIRIEEIPYNPNIYFSNDWNINQKTEIITLITQKVSRENSQSAHDEDRRNPIDVGPIKKETININFKDISNISIESANEMHYILWGGLILVGTIVSVVLWYRIFEELDYEN